MPLPLLGVHFFTQSILRRVGIRKLPEVCLYFAKGTGIPCEFKVAPRILFVLDKSYAFVKGVFCLYFFQTDASAPPVIERTAGEAKI